MKVCHGRYLGSEVPKPNPGSPNLKSRLQDERAKVCVRFLCRGTSDPGYGRYGLPVYILSAGPKLPPPQALLAINIQCTD